jgi:hypothetical protein
MSVCTHSYVTRIFSRPFLCASGVAIASGPIPASSLESALIGKNYNIFQDDCSEGFSSFDELFAFLSDHFFPLAKWFKLRINWSTTILFVHWLKQLGIVISAGGKISIDPQRVAKLVDFAIPMNKTQIRSFICKIRLSGLYGVCSNGF